MKLEEMGIFIKTIHSDVNACIERINADEDMEFWARMYIRSLASLVEGTSYMYRDIIRGLWQGGEIKLTTEQQLFFLNLDWRVVNSGQIETTEKKLPSKESLKCLLTQIGVILPSYKPDFVSKGWAQLLEFYQTRDALIHPKTLIALHIKKDKLKELDVGRAWFANECRNINDALIKDGSKIG